MKILTCAAIALTLSLGAAQAQSLNKDTNGGKQNAPGTTGAMGNVNANGVATDPRRCPGPAGPFDQCLARKP